MTVRQLEAGRADVENQYARAVAARGTPAARDLVYEVFEVVDRKWRGVGAIPKSGLRLAHEYRAHDAERLFEVDAITTNESPLCISGRILRGLAKPCDCPAFGRQCTPQTPLGATMVSSEGACAAYYQYARYLERAPPPTPPDASRGEGGPASQRGSS
jgi:hydrogenase expression/formation protein HypD